MLLTDCCAVTLGDLYACRGVEEMIVEGPADVLGGVDANWSKILIRVSNADVFIVTSHEWIGGSLLENL